jgi:tetraacyldisaccharide 4'-kinase
VLRARLQPDLGHLDPAGRYLAFAGIGRPEKFFAGLRSGGLTLIGARAFADHHAYSPSELARLRQEAAAADARLLTTPKDRARLAVADRTGIVVGGVGLVWDDEARIDGVLRAAMGR